MKGSIPFIKPKGENKMTVKELIGKLSSLDSDAEVLIQYMKSDLYGSSWEEVEDFDEDHIIVKRGIVILDISDK